MPSSLVYSGKSSLLFILEKCVHTVFIHASIHCSIFYKNIHILFIYALYSIVYSRKC